VTASWVALRPPKRLASEGQETDARGGLSIFHASWGMVFLQAPVWPPSGTPPVPKAVQVLAVANTAILLASSLALRRGVRALEVGRPRGIRLPLAATLLLGGVFLALQVESWRGLWLGGLSFRNGTYESLLYGLTAFHALHVVAGLGVLLWILPVGSRGEARPLTVGDRIRVRSAAAFWHFVDAAWFATFLTVYVL
jgi:heme/copper-type cytochrome/quinol oxidase subunit 3